MRFLTLTALLTIFLLPGSSVAQLGGASGAGPSFSLSVSPQYPAPYSKAILSAESSTLDLVNTTMTVTVKGVEIYQGAVQPVSLTLGGAGSITRVLVDISSGGTRYTKEVSIQTQDVSLIVEPVSSAPPLYPGKPLTPSLGGNARVVAVANFRNVSGIPLDPSTLSYAWTVDDTKIDLYSGIGKSALLVASPLPYRGRTVSVTIRSQDGSLVGGSEVSLTPGDPSVRIYENDPLLGIRFDRALTNTFSILSTEATLYAAPFSLPIVSSLPTLAWFLNGSPAQTGSGITLRPAGEGQGSASLSVTASSGDQSASASLPLSFGTTENSNFFGL